MSDETTKTDADVIAHYRKWRTEPRPLPSERVELYVQIEGYAIVADAALRTIDALTAERDAARDYIKVLEADIKRQREEIQMLKNDRANEWAERDRLRRRAGVPEMLDMYGIELQRELFESDPDAQDIFAKADALRAALGESEATG
jgi:hypothetical protein